MVENFADANGNGRFVLVASLGLIGYFRSFVAGNMISIYEPFYCTRINIGIQSNF